MANNDRYPVSRSSPIGNIIGLVLIVVILGGLFMILRGIFNLLYFLSPVLLIATLIIDYKVVLSYIKQLGLLFTRNPLYGIGAGVLTFLLFPVVISVLLFRAYSGKKVAQFSGRYTDDDGEFVEYEEADDELDLGQKVKEKRYNDYFKED